MKRWTLLLALACLSACSTMRPAVELHRVMTGSAARIDQPGVSFTVSPGRTWSFLVRSTYQALLGAVGASANETYVTAESTFDLPSTMTPDQFLAHVKKQRAAEPQTGRFETIRNAEELYTGRSEVCVKHRMTSKDYGAKRGGEFTYVDYLGMNCVHPSSPRIGVFVEFSRKAPTAADASFDEEAMRLLESVAFHPFH